MPLPTVLSVGRSRVVAQKVAGAIAPLATVHGIYGVDFSEVTFLAALRLIHPRPQVLLFGGGYSDDEAERAEVVFKDFWTEMEADAEEENGRTTTFVRVKVGTLEGGGPGAVIAFIKDEITKAFPTQ